MSPLHAVARGRVSTEMPVSDERFVPVAMSPGVTTERLYLGYVEVSDAEIEQTERVFGVAAEGEQITRQFVSLEELADMEFHDLKTWALAQWVLRSIRP